MGQNDPKKCIDCGCIITNPHNARKRCEECAKEKIKEDKRIASRELSAKRKAQKHIKNNIKSISEICRLASEKGMSYGEYVAKFM